MFIPYYFCNTTPMSKKGSNFRIRLDSRILFAILLPTMASCILVLPSFHQDPGEAWKFAELDGLVAYLREAASNGQFTPDPLVPFSSMPSSEVAYALLRQIQK